jgi:hypothetical protein
MVRLTGYVEVAGRRELLDWTITNTGVVEHAGLSSAGITIKADQAPVAPSSIPTPETPVAAPVEAKSLEDMNKTELQVECNNRGLSPTGTKAELLERLNAGEEEGEAEAEPSTEGDGNGEGNSE